MTVKGKQPQLLHDIEQAFVIPRSRRGRWHIENRCFYVLDTVLGDDASRSRTSHAVVVLNDIRLATLNLACRLTQTVGSLCREHTLNPNLLMNRLRIFKN